MIPKDEGTLIVEGEPTAYLPTIDSYAKSNNLNFPRSSLSILSTLYSVPSTAYPTAYNASAAIWRDAHMLCHASNLAALRSKARLPVWRYRWDHVAPNLNSRGVRIGAFHGSDIRFVMGQWRTIVLSPPFVAATEEQVKISDLMVTAWTNFIKGEFAERIIHYVESHNADDRQTPTKAQAFRAGRSTTHGGPLHLQPWGPRPQKRYLGTTQRLMQCVSIGIRSCLASQRHSQSAEVGHASAGFPHPPERGLRDYLCKKSDSNAISNTVIQVEHKLLRKDMCAFRQTTNARRNGGSAICAVDALWRRATSRKQDAFVTKSWKG